jgi:CRISPR-associated protein Cas2
MRLWLVSYDIGNDKVRRAVEKALEAEGERVNFSVFECYLTPISLQRLRGDLAAVIDAKTDSIRYYPLCAWCADRVTWQGRGLRPEDRADWIV